MSELVANCPRCGSEKITFDLTKEHQVGHEHGWQQWYEAFCICRRCKKSTIFLLSQNNEANPRIVQTKGLAELTDAVNRYMKIERYISLKDATTVHPPEHVPEKITAIFREGATCLAVQCFNAAGTMFRLCVDLATLPLLPEKETEGLNSKVRRDLGLRLPWLFDNHLLPENLRDLSTCIKEDGNDGAHRGSLEKDDADDLLDFTLELLKNIYTGPARVKAANQRRAERRKKG